MRGGEGKLPAIYPPHKVGRRSGKAAITVKQEEDELSSNASFPPDLLQAFRFGSTGIVNRGRVESKYGLRGRQQPQRTFNWRRKDQQSIDEASILKEITSPKRLNREDGKDKDKFKCKEEPEHLAEVCDHVKEDMDVLLIGSNPGRMSSRKGRHFAHPSNHFYRALHGSGLTPTQVSPDDDYTLLHQPLPYFSLGLTNLAARPTRMAQDLNKSEEAMGTEILTSLIRRYRPRVGIFVGIGVAKAYERCLKELKMWSEDVKREEKVEEDEGEKSFRRFNISRDIPLVSDKHLGLGVGLMSVAVRHGQGDGITLLYAMPSTSGRVTTHQLKEKTECMAFARLLAIQRADLDRKAEHDEQNRQEIRVEII